MDCRPIPYHQIPHTTALFRDYVYDFARVSAFYRHSPFDAGSLLKSAESLRYPDELRVEVAEVLRAQNERFSGSPETARNLERFSRPGCCAVVTGQQVGLFSGPAFTFYKALTAIKLARNLTERGIEAVPIFWLATEDHDLAEVNHCFVQDREGKPVRVEYSEPPQVPNAPVGAVSFTEAIRPLVGSLRAALPDTQDAVALLALLEESYVPGAHFGGAFARVLAGLFAKYGVIMAESLDSRLHELSRGVFRTAIECQREISSELQNRNLRLTQAGYHEQVRVSDGSSLLFLYEDGQRTALRVEDGKFTSSLGRQYKAGELLSLLESNPALFSPNALLRPVMQDALLPTVAYVGGPAEIAYLAQAAPLYERMLGRMPVISPRASFTLADAAASRALGKYDLSLPDVLVGRQALREKMASRFIPGELAAAFQASSAHLRDDLQALQQNLRQLDPTLADAASNSAQKMQYQLANLERKAAVAVQNRSDLIERDATRLENTLFPDKTLQERTYTGISLLARYGTLLLDQLYEQIRLDSGDHLLITL
jgi:bacillithiol biosynthesis cysteine-adding enzyme BshC